jgi:predicted Rossmann fold flavoprotein
VSKNEFDLIVIGGGAAGFFGAIQAAEHKTGMQIVMLEKTSKLLSKVRISGGGRCNVTHFCFDPYEFSGHFPRGERHIKGPLKRFHAQHIVEWFARVGVILKTENDGRMFPTTDSSETIIDCFMREARDHKIKIEVNREVLRITKESNGFLVKCSTGEYVGRKILIATGGSPKVSSYSWIQSLGHLIKSPIPSLFTFNDSEKNFVDLMGVAVPNALVKIASTKFTQSGPILITHWGLSGPAIIKLSAWAAAWLHEQQYDFTVLVSWLGSSEDDTRAMLMASKSSRGKQRARPNPPEGLPLRLWERLCEKAEVEEHRIWAELSNRMVNKLVEYLVRCPFKIKGKTTFKDEFVTCGGVPLDEVNLDTMESKLVGGLYFAGEVLNIDGETGGFNFQSAWTTAYIAAQAISK